MGVLRATYLPVFSQCGPEQLCKPMVYKELSLKHHWPTGSRSNFVLDILIWLLITLQPPWHHIVLRL